MLRWNDRMCLTYLAINLTRLAICQKLFGLLFLQAVGEQPNLALKARVNASPEPKPTDNAICNTVTRGCATSRIAATSTRRRRR